METKLHSILFASFIAVILVGWFSLSPYLSKQQAQKDRGVVTYQRSHSFQGTNLYCSMNQPRAYLIDMEGRELHAWKGRRDDPRGWHHVELAADGSLYTVMTDNKIERLGWNSAPLWKAVGRFHHDIDIAPWGDVYAIERRDEVVSYQGLEIRILNDYITVFSLTGEKKAEHSLFELVKELIPEKRMIAAKRFVEQHNPRFLENDTPVDIFHTNTIELIERDVEGFAKAGNVLLALRDLDMIAVVDLKTQSLVWSWGSGTLDRPHQPTLLDNNHLLIFDNGRYRGQSRVLEIEPQSLKVMWSYGENQSERFYSSYRGGAQRLPNGNTLITKGEAGEVFEITRSGSVVWKFLNPHFKQGKERRETIYRMTRLQPGTLPSELLTPP